VQGSMRQSCVDAKRAEEEEDEEDEEDQDTESKTRTPHKVVGNYSQNSQLYEVCMIHVVVAFLPWPEQVYNFIWLGKNMRHVYTAFILSNKKYWRLFHHGYIHKISPYQQMHCQEGSCWTIELPYALYPHCPYILRLNCEVCVLLPSRRPWTFEQAASWWLAQAFYTFCIVDEWF
jgi:hypothetical protein